MKVLRFTDGETVCEMDHLGEWTLIAGDAYVKSALEFLMVRFEIQPGSPHGNWVKEIPELHRSMGVMKSGVFEQLVDSAESEDTDGPDPPFDPLAGEGTNVIY